MFLNETYFDWNTGSKKSSHLIIMQIDTNDSIHTHDTATISKKGDKEEKKTSTMRFALHTTHNACTHIFVAVVKSSYFVDITARGTYFSMMAISAAAMGSRARFRSS